MLRTGLIKLFVAAACVGAVCWDFSGIGVAAAPVRHHRGASNNDRPKLAAAAVPLGGRTNRFEEAAAGTNRRRLGHNDDEEPAANPPPQQPAGGAPAGGGGPGGGETRDVDQMLQDELEEEMAKATLSPTGTPTAAPTEAPTPIPTTELTEEPTAEPTAEETEEPTEQPTTEEPWWEETLKPTLRPTLFPTRFPTSQPTPEINIAEMPPDFGSPLEPTSEPTDGVDVGGGTRDVAPPDLPDGPIVLDRWVRVNLKSVEGTLNSLQTVAFEDAATAFLSELFQLTVPVVYNLAVEVTGQKVLEGAGSSRSRRTLLETETEMKKGGLRRAPMARRLQSKPGDDAGDNAGPASDAMMVAEEGEDDEQLLPLQIDMRVSGRFDPTENHRTADDVNFDSMCRNFFTVNGGAVVSRLNAMADQAMEGGVGGLDGSGLEYFATVEEIRGVTPPASGPAGGGGDDPTLLNAGGEGDDNRLAYIIAIGVGSAAFIGLVATMCFIARKNKRKKASPGRSSSKKSESRSRSKSKSKGNGSVPPPPKKYSPKKRSKQSHAALSMMSDEEAADSLPPGSIDSPEEAQSEVGSLARFHTLEADKYSYHPQKGSGKSSRSAGPLFKNRSNNNGALYDNSNGNANGTSNLYSPRNDDDDDDDYDDDYDEDGFGDAADDATFSAFGKMLSSPGSTFNTANVLDSKAKNNLRSPNADDYRQKDSMMNLSPSTAGLGSPLAAAAIAEEPEEKPRKKKKKTFGASARRKNDAFESALGESEDEEQPQKKSTLGSLSIDGSAAAAGGKKDPLSPDADAWLYETITDVLGDEQSTRTGKSVTPSFSNDITEKKSSSKPFSPKKKKSSKNKSRSKFASQAVPEDDVAEDTTIPTPMEYTPGGDDKSVMTTVTKLEDAGMVRRECYAPPGKLGVVIDSTSRGPVVHEVKGGSPLEGIVFPGDRIIAIDGEDTKTLPASMVTKIMAAKKDQQRRMTLLSVVTGIDG